MEEDAPAGYVNEAADLREYEAVNPVTVVTPVLGLGLGDIVPQDAGASQEKDATSNRHLLPASRNCCGGRRHLVTTLVSLAIATMDITTDLINYSDFSTRSHALDQDHVPFSALSLSVIVYISTALYALFVLTMVFKWLSPYSCWTRHADGALTFSLWVIEDIATLALLVGANAQYYCPLVAQFRTTKGRVALASIGVSILWRTAFTCAGCAAVEREEEDNTVRKNQPGTGLLFVACLLVFISIVLTGWSFQIAFSPDPNHSQPVYIRQTVGARFYLHRKYNTTSGKTLSAGANETGTEVVWRNVTCDEFTYRFPVGGVSDLYSTGVVSRTVPCQQVSPLYSYFLQPEHAQFSNQTVACSLGFKLEYDKAQTEIRYNVRYQLRLNDGACVNGSVTTAPVDIQSSAVWRHWTIPGAIWRKECGVHCPPQTAKLNESRKGDDPYFSCHQTACDWNPTTQSQRMPITVQSFQFEIDNLTFPCHMSARLDPSLELDMECGADNDTPPKHSAGDVTSTSRPPTEVLYCQHPANTYR